MANQNYMENFKNMEENAIYYVEEGKGKETHPLCDIFFKTKKKELVLIDVTGGGEKTVKEKVDKFSSQIRHSSSPTTRFSMN